MGRRVSLCFAIYCVLAAIGIRADARGFTVADDIGISRFVDPFQTLLRSPIRFSPDGRYFAVVTERGLIKPNMIEDAVWVFSTAEVSASLTRPHGSLSSLPAPLTKLTAPRAPVISYIRWSSDSSGLAFLAAGSDGNHQLYKINIKDKHLQRLSNSNQDVTAFDIQGTHVIYSAVSSLAADVKSAQDDLGSVTVGTGLDIGRVVLGKLPNSPLQKLKSLCTLWVLKNGKPLMVQDKKTHRPIYIHQSPNSYGIPVFRVSPDGTRVVAQFAVQDVPSAWEQLPPSDELPARRIKAGSQDVLAPRLLEPINEYVVIDLFSGSVTSLTHAPIGWEDAYYSVYPAIAWASDSQSVALANTFIAEDTNDSSNKLSSGGRPCIAVVNVANLATTCAMRLPSNTSELLKAGLHRLINVRFDGDGADRIIVDAIPERAEGGSDLGNIVHLYFNRNSSGSWMESGSKNEMADDLLPFTVSVEQNLNSPPQLIARERNAGVSRILLNPNEDMREVALGDASVFHWEDNQGRRWTGGLVKPPNYTPGVKYPLVLQTHGFDPAAFITYGSFPSCMAARELSAAGILVLQIAGPANEVQWDDTSQEGSMEVAGFDSAVDQLAQDGMIDRDRVGIIGFSRTVYGVLDALTTGETRYRAASICDGIQGGYLEYMLSVDAANNEMKRESDALIGASPFGEGLQTWIRRSPNFNLDKVSAPVMVQAFGTISTLFMWEPYAGLRLLGKPVELLVVNAGDEHVLSNPLARAASQGTNVDWFRFWLQGYEDSDPPKAEQYRRWEKLCDKQVAENTEHPTFCASTRQ